MRHTNFFRQAIPTAPSSKELVMLAILIVIAGVWGFILDSQRNQEFRTNPVYRAELRQELHRLRLAAGCMQLSQQSRKYDVLMNSYNRVKAHYNSRAEEGGFQGEMLLEADLLEYTPAYYGYMIDVWQECKEKKLFSYALNA